MNSKAGKKPKAISYRGYLFGLVIAPALSFQSSINFGKVRRCFFINTLILGRYVPFINTYFIVDDIYSEQLQI